MMSCVSRDSLNALLMLKIHFGDMLSLYGAKRSDL